MATDNSNTHTPRDTSDGDLAADVIRNKIEALYAKEQTETHEPNAVAEENEVITEPHRSKHQQYMYQLSQSGKSLAEIQTAWHQYYQNLPDDQKHEVWKEFYSEHAKAKQRQAEHDDKVRQEAAKETASSAHKQTVRGLKHQLLGKVSQRSKAKLKTKQHLQAIGFGLGCGAIVVFILLFGFFNERFIAPFITPSKTVSNTPIISDSTLASSSTPQVIIPKINVQIPVIYNNNSIDEASIQSSLENGVVHYATTPSPGEQGNVVIFGHSSNNILNKGKYKFAFVLLNKLEVGDTFTLTKDGKRYVYRVYEKKIVKPNDVSVMGPTDKPATATLITCDPPGTSLNRLVVIGEQISPDPSKNTPSTAVASSQTPTIIPSNAESLWQRIIHLF